MSVSAPRPRSRSPLRQGRTQVEGLVVLAGIVSIMWILEAINSLDSNRIAKSDGIYARNVDHIWAIFTAPFLHFSFQHLIANTVPFLFMGVIIALQGARRLLLVTLVIIVVGGVGTWVFGYATYLFARGFFNRSVLELLTGLVVGVVWGGALLSSVVPHTGVSWQGHVCGAIGGVVAAYLVRRDRPAKPSAKPMSPLDRALAG
jgi:membrane associated rhomboid family serine protease